MTVKSTDTPRSPSGGCHQLQNVEHMRMGQLSKWCQLQLFVEIVSLICRLNSVAQFFLKTHTQKRETEIIALPPWIGHC